MVYKSLYEDQESILEAIISLHCPSGFDVDATFGNGGFYKGGIKEPKYKYDLDENLVGCEQASSTKLPLEDSSVSSVVFDPPFLTYIKSGREGNGRMVMANRFGGYWKYDELESHYKESLTEFHRVLGKKGIVVFKCQDIVHNHKLQPTHINVVNWAVNFRLKDLFILTAKHRMPSPNKKGVQRHSRIYHSYFLVLEKL